MTAGWPVPWKRPKHHAGGHHASYVTLWPAHPTCSRRQSYGLEHHGVSASESTFEKSHSGPACQRASPSHRARTSKTVECSRSGPRRDVQPGCISSQRSSIGAHRVSASQLHHSQNELLNSQLADGRIRPVPAITFSDSTSAAGRVARRTRPQNSPDTKCIEATKGHGFVCLPPGAS